MNSTSLLSRFSSKRGESWESICRRVSSIGRLADSEKVHHAVSNMHILPSGQILRNAGVPGACMSSCLVLDDPNEATHETVWRVGRYTTEGLGVGINLSRKINDTEDRLAALFSVIDKLSVVQERNVANGVQRTATGLVIDTVDLDYAAVLSNYLVSTPRNRHFTLSVRLPSNELETLLGTPTWLELLDTIMTTGLPGIIFSDRVGQRSKNGLEVTSANPCVEQHMGDGEVCTLASLNVRSIFSGKLSSNGWGRLEELSGLGLRLLVDATRASNYRDDKISSICSNYMRVGLGLAGIGSLFDDLGVRYGSTRSIKIAARLAKAVKDAAHSEASKIRAIGKFPSNCLRICTSIAPTGAVSRLPEISPGIAPVDYRKVDPKEQIRLIAAMQEFVDSGISTTVVLPRDVSRERLRSILLLASDLKLKGVSCFREGTNLASFDERAL